MNDRIEQFKQDIEDMRLKTQSSGSEQGLQALGVVLMVLGIILALGGFFSSTGQGDPRDQNELIILAIGGLCLTITGAALFLRYSLAKFLRFWLLRQLYEGQAHIDQVVDAIRTPR
ncbi:MAG: hypothetical protein MUE34_12635 [Acidimicrobiales bacterium]|jgi:hypothetical protein|nr:hypothetical protein [Acidimicrobiales bacterium]